MTDLVTKIGDDDFNACISEGIVLVDFYAEGCAPCQALDPILEELAQEVVDKIIVAKVDVEHSEKTTVKLKVTSTPTLVLLKDGKELKRVTGIQDMDTLRSMISEVL